MTSPQSSSRDRRDGAQAGAQQYHDVRDRAFADAPNRDLTTTPHTDGIPAEGVTMPLTDTPPTHFGATPMGETLGRAPDARAAGWGTTHAVGPNEPWASAPIPGDIPSTAAINGHPIHPILITFPVAFLSGALITDIIYLLTRAPFWAEASFWLLVGGIISGAVAGIFGSIDFWSKPQIRSLRIAWLHMFGNVAALALAIVNAVLRNDAPADAIWPVGFLISLVIAGLLGLSGFFGGEMVYRHRVGVDSRPRNNVIDGEKQPSLAGD